MNHFTFSALLASSFSFIAFLGIFSANISQPLKRILCAYWFSIAFWAFFVGTQAPTIRFLSPFWWGWFLILGCTFIPAFFFHSSLIFAKRETPTTRRMLIGSYCITFLFNLLNLSTGLFTNETVYRDMYAYPKPEFLFIFYFLLFDVLVIWGTVLLFDHLRVLSGQRREGLKLLLATHILAYVGGMDNFLIMIDVRIPPLYPYGLYLIPPYALVVIYAARCRGLFERVISQEVKVRQN